MSAFCTHCGAPLGVGTAFCNACGHEASPLPAPPIDLKTPSKRRTISWVLALIVLFLLGILVGRLFAPKCPECPNAGDLGGAGAAAAGHARAAEQEKGDAHIGGKPVNGPADAGAGGGDSKIDASEGSGKIVPHDVRGEESGGANGEHKSNSDEAPPDRAPAARNDEEKLQGDVVTLAAGHSPYGNTQSRSAMDPTTGTKAFSARDFSFDKTNLPRYPTGVSVVASSIVYATNLKTGEHTGAYGTGAGIVTNSSFDDVLAWYQSHVPAGWQSTAIGDVSQLAQQANDASSNKILQLMLGQSGSPQENHPATPAVPKLKMSLFKPPGIAADAQNGSIMIVQEEGKPVTVYLQTRVE